MNRPVAVEVPSAHDRDQLVNERQTMMKTQEQTAHRLERYLTLASLPALGLAAQASADIVHYGGPAIQIDRSAHMQGEHNGRHVGSAFFGMPASFEQVCGINRSMTAALSSEYAFASAAVRTGLLSNGGVDGFGFAVCGDAAVGQLGGLAGSFFGTSGSVGCDFLHMFQSGEVIQGDQDFAANGAVAMSASAMATMFGDTVVDASVSSGEWASADAEGARGFVGWEFENGSETIYGWMDVAWDGEILSIHDWAFSTDGGILAGQTSALTAVPGGTGLAVLAMGAAGLRRRRKRGA